MSFSIILGRQGKWVGRKGEGRYGETKGQRLGDTEWQRDTERLRDTERQGDTERQVDTEWQGDTERQGEAGRY